jgi:hypothetical protein
MARQQDVCWRCDTPWAEQRSRATRLAPRRRLRPGHGARSPAVAGDAHALAQARLDMDRWVDEGGTVPFEAAALLRGTKTRR